MRWEDEPYIKGYKRETPEWTLHVWQVRALHFYILKFLDRVGLLELGKSGLKALASVTRVPVEVLEHCMPVWLADGCFVLMPDGKGGEWLFAPNYLQAQEARSTDAARKRAERERVSDRAKAVAALGLDLPKPPPSPRSRAYAQGTAGAPPCPVSRAEVDGGVQEGLVLGQHAPVRDAPVPYGTLPSHAVTVGHSEKRLTEQSKAEQDQTCGQPHTSASLRQSGTYPSEPQTRREEPTSEGDAIVEELRRWPIFARLGDIDKVADALGGLAMSGGKKTAWVCKAIVECSTALSMEEATTGQELPPERIRGALRGFVNRARRPAVTPEEAELRPDLPSYVPAQPPRSVIKAAFAQRGQNLDAIERPNADAYAAIDALAASGSKGSR
jgi:hypothetical protein